MDKLAPYAKSLIVLVGAVAVSIARAADVGGVTDEMVAAAWVAAGAVYVIPNKTPA